MKQDWMSYLAKFVDTVKSLSAGFAEQRISEEQVRDVVHNYFLDAHVYEEPQLNLAMINAWRSIDLAMQKLKEEWDEKAKFTPDDLFRKHMREMFNDLSRTNDTRIPVGTRAYFMWQWAQEAERPYLH